MSKHRPTYQELVKRLAVAEPIVAALRQHEVDAVVGKDKVAVLLLREVGEALQNSTADFQALFALPGIGMIQAAPPALRLTQVNQKFCEITGFTAAELLTKTYIDLTAPADRLRDLNALAPLLRNQTNSWSIQKRCLHKDGHIILMDVHGVALHDATGRIVRILATISDLTPPGSGPPRPPEDNQKSPESIPAPRKFSRIHRK